MQSKFYYSILLFCTIFSFSLSAQVQLPLLGSLSYNGNTQSSQNLSDVWGWTNGTKEYAIVGQINGTSIVDVTTPSTANEVAFIPGPSTTWRDMKTWGNYAYVTNESSGGLHIINLSGLPNSVTDVFYTGNNGVNFSSAHNIYIDEFGIGYIFGANTGAGGAIMIDIAANPTNPPVVGHYTQEYFHDGYVRNNMMYGSAINNGWFSIVDVSNKSNPIRLATKNTTNNFTHNAWLSDDSQTLFTTDETGNAEIGSYDISNLSNITRIDGIKSSPGNNVIPHNVHVLNDCLFTSYYNDGLHVVDANRPDILVEVAYYDTYPAASGGSFDGCWGAYPFLPSGNILASDQTNGLFIIGGNHPCATYIEGTITDAATGNPINNVSINIAGYSVAATTSNSNGSYATGIAGSGTVTVTYTAAGYGSVTQNVNLTNCQNNFNNVQMGSVGTIALNGQVIDANTGAPISGADVYLVEPASNNTFTTNGAGNFSGNIFSNTTYDVYAGKWGYITELLTNQSFVAGSTLIIELDQGYCDDFALDLGWATSSNGASTGFWSLGEPIGTTFNGADSNPDFDITSDLSDQCYVTGNGGGSAGNDDIDGGEVILTSPTFNLSTYNDPYIDYSRWFFNAGGNSTPDDQLIVEISNNNGASYTNVETVADGDPNEGQWANNNFRVLNFTTLTANMKMRFRSYDLGDGHLVEAGVDGFCVTDSSLPAPTSSFTANTTSGCGAVTVTFNDQSSNNPSSWNWSFPGGSPSSSTLQNPTVTYNSPGTYNVSLTASNSGGQGNTITQNNLVQVFAIPNAPAVSGGNTYCIGDAVSNLTASGSNITWYSNASGTNPIGSGNNYTPSSSGTATYYATQTINGCESVTTSETVTINPNPSVSFSLPTSVNAATPLNLTASPSGGTFSGTGVVFNGFNPSIAGSGQHIITYSYTDANGCSATASSSILVFSINYNFVNYNLGTISPLIGDIFDGKLNIQPNPVIQNFNVSFELSDIVEEALEYRIYDMSGKLLRTNYFNISGEYHNETIDISNFTKGTYILSVVTKDGIINKNIIKQ